MSTIHPRFAAARTGVRLATWWAKAWQRTVEETAYDERDLVTARSLARGGRVGGIIVDPGSFVAAVEGPEGLFTVAGRIPAYDDATLSALVAAVGATAGRVAALLAGELPHELVEEAEDAGAELLPSGPDVEVVCTCEHWVSPCPHALAVMLQLGWLIDADPFALLELRGVHRDDLLQRVHRLNVAQAADGADRNGDVGERAETGGAVDDVDIALDAALRAGRLLDDWR